MTTKNLPAPTKAKAIKGEILPPLNALAEPTKFQFTEKRIEALPAPHPSGKQKLYWDEEVTGFGLLVSGVTNSKTFFAQRKDPKGKTVRVKIDRTNRAVSLDKVREEALDILEKIRKEGNPKAARKASATASKYGEMTLKEALNAYLAGRADGEEALRPKSQAMYRAAIEKDLSGWLDLPLRDITAPMVLEQHKMIQKRVAKERKNGKGHATANGAMRSLRTVWNYTQSCEALERAEATKLAAKSGAQLPPPEFVTNPVNGLTVFKQWFPKKVRDRHVEDEDLPRFYNALDAMAAENRTGADFLKMLLFTGARRSEMARLEWKELNFTARAIKVPEEKTKTGEALALPMSSYVFDLLSARRDLGREKSGFVFAASGVTGYLREPKHLFALVQKATGIKISSHDLRRTFATVAESTNISPWALKALLNHSLGKGVTAGYIQMKLERLASPGSPWIVGRVIFHPNNSASTV